jgi:3-methyl-2-oxobutanoate hydroxymethyltransferase
METGCDAVKLEGCSEKILQGIKFMDETGIPVMGHLGLTPQHIKKFGTYKARGKDEAEAERILEDALKLEKAGVFAIVLEKIPHLLAKKISESVSIPTIGIGAGKYCDGQILVYADMLGINVDFHPRFVRKYANLYETIKESVINYSNDVANSDFPNEQESY